MISTRLFQRTSIFFLTLTLPVSMFAATVAETLTTPDDQTVSRGDFLRATVIVLGLPMEKNARTTGTYARPVPKTLQPYVHVAEKYGAVDVFGRDLGLGKAITRGEAVEFIVRLQKLESAGLDMHFSDADAGSSLENALGVAVEREWIAPVRSNYFGVSRSLSGREAKLLLRKVVGENEAVIEQGPTGEPKTNAVVVKFKSRELPPLPQNQLLQTVWRFLTEQYLYQEKIDETEAAYRAAEAMTQSLGDPYTTFLRPSLAKEFDQRLSGEEVFGIGAQVEYRDNRLIVVAPLSGSPAEKAGVKAGDEIIMVDGETLENLNLVDAVNKVRGPKGTTVLLRIRRNDTELDISVTRDSIKIPEIDISFQGDIAVVKLIQFGQTTDRELRALMMDIEERHPKGMVLDLRNNPGGLLHAAEIVLSNFLPKGSQIAIIKANNEEYKEVTADPPTIDTSMPLVVLVNKGSASASEIVAGALQDAKRAIVMGEKTFGKGTVQQLIDFNDGSSLKMTIAEWFTPMRRKINGVGLEPDIVVLPSDARDEQLLKAIDFLR